MSKEAMKLALEAAYLAGWNASGEGYNAEYPFGDHARNPEEDAVWVKDRDNALQEALAEQPAQPLIPFRHGCKWCGKTDGCEHQQPSQRKPLTDDEMDAALRKAGVLATFEALRCIGREVEAAHGIKEKNT